MSPPEAGQAQGTGGNSGFGEDWTTYVLPKWSMLDVIWDKYMEVSLPGLDLILPKVPTTFGGGLVMMAVYWCVKCSSLRDTDSKSLWGPFQFSECMNPYKKGEC